MPHPITLTTAIALAHERLYPRVEALRKQVERSATRHPQDPVPPATLAAAKPLFAEARKIIGREAMLMAEKAGENLLALGIGLGQLLGALEAFEAENSGFVAKLGRVAWTVPGEPLPVARLKPRDAQKTTPPRHDGVEPGFRSKLYKRMCERENQRYMQGFRDGKAGRPPIAPIRFLDGIPQED